MLARLARELPRGDFLYEPKWDGFRALAFRDGGDVSLWSRNARPLARYFPELVEALLALPAERFALDGEIVLTREGVFDFPGLMSRLHPAPSRVERLRRELPASLVAFDLLAEGDDDLTAAPFGERRRRLEALFGPAAGRTFPTEITGDANVAAEWLERCGGGVDGVVAKRRDAPYEPGKRSMVKVKRERTADCGVAGVRWMHDGEAVGSLLLGLYDDAGALRHVGVVTSFRRERRATLLEELRPRATTIEGHPWERGFGLGRSPLGRLLGAAGRWDPDEMPLEWVPLRPELVCEVAHDQLDEGRFRHPARFRRWRPDREPRSCTLDQLRLAPRALEAIATA